MRSSGDPEGRSIRSDALYPARSGEWEVPVTRNAKITPVNDGVGCGVGGPPLRDHLWQGPPLPVTLRLIHPPRVPTAVAGSIIHHEPAPSSRYVVSVITNLQILQASRPCCRHQRHSALIAQRCKGGSPGFVPVSGNLCADSFSAPIRPHS